MGNIFKTYQQTNKSSSNNNMAVGDVAIEQENETAVRKVIDSAGKTVSKVMESGGDILAAPGVWIKDIQQNWYWYMLFGAIIALSLGFIYCSFRCYLNRKKTNVSNSNLLELAKIISSKGNVVQQQLPLSVIDLFSAPSNVPKE